MKRHKKRRFLRMHACADAARACAARALRLSIVSEVIVLCESVSHLPQAPRPQHNSKRRARTRACACAACTYACEHTRGFPLPCHGRVRARVILSCVRAALVCVRACVRFVCVCVRACVRAVPRQAPNSSLSRPAAAPAGTSAAPGRLPPLPAGPPPRRPARLPRRARLSGRLPPLPALVCRVGRRGPIWAGSSVPAAP
jgi:hypothetical protein